MSIWVHTIVKNEENFIWYALRSIVEYVDKCLVWDTGSSDSTLKIVKAAQKFFPGKIDIKEVGEVSQERIARVRQKMLNATEADWFINLDGDEVWWNDSIGQLVNLINTKGNQIESVFVRILNPVGDIYHFQPEEAGFYQIGGKRGHLTIRAFSTKIPGLHVGGSFPKEGYLDRSGVRIQDRRPFFLDVSYLHLTHLKRSASEKLVVGRRHKYSYELGSSAPYDFYYPEAFFEPRPSFVPSPWSTRPGSYAFRAFFETPLKRFKRNLTKIIDK